MENLINENKRTEETEDTKREEIPDSSMHECENNQIRNITSYDAMQMLDELQVYFINNKIDCVNHIFELKNSVREEKMNRRSKITDFIKLSKK